MRLLTIFAGLVLLAATAGCSDGTDEAPPVDPQAPLTVENWMTLEAEKRYEPENLDRLRKHDPKLASDEAWDQFMRDVVIPQRKIDIPMTPAPATPEE